MTAPERRQKYLSETERVEVGPPNICAPKPAAKPHELEATSSSSRTGPDDVECVRILKGLLKLSRAGQIGPIYCTGRILEIGTWAIEYRPLHVCMERRVMSWKAASDLVEGMEAVSRTPLERKPVASTKRVSNLRRLIQKRLA